MLVIENDNYDSHNPHWSFTLGPNTYVTRDTPARVEVIKSALSKVGGFNFMNSKRFPEKLLAEMHPYQLFIKTVCRAQKDPKSEVYPDLFPGEGAHLPKKMKSELWGGLFCTDAVTPLTMHTYDVARGSAEAAMTGAELVSRGKAKEVYALCRPSGHHAGPRVFGGYCYFNNTAMATSILRKSGRVAVLDIDYHHGNGTQEFFYSDAQVLTLSIHGDPEFEYPYFWGYEEENGSGEGKDKNLNIPLKLGSENKKYLTAVDRAIEKIREYSPAYLVIAAGFDTHRDDPIGGFGLTTRIYSTIGERLGELALPTVICQEGGYNTEVLGDCVLGFLQGFVKQR